MMFDYDYIGVLGWSSDIYNRLEMIEKGDGQFVLEIWILEYFGRK